MKSVDVLGTTYRIYESTEKEDKFLSKCDGYYDKTSKKIVIANKPEDNELENYSVYKKSILRHEIIHAFMYESGLSNNWEHKNWGQEETTVDWFAIQSPKIFEAFKQANCL